MTKEKKIAIVDEPIIKQKRVENLKRIYNLLLSKN